MIPLLRCCTIILCFCFVLFPINSAGQQNISTIDSLIRTIPRLIKSDQELAVKLTETLLTISSREGHSHGVIQSIFYKAWLSYRSEPADKVIFKIDSALNHIKGINNDTALIKFYILKGQCYVKKSQFSSALDNFNIALNIAEKRNDTGSKTNTMISIGWAYMEDGKPAEAIRFFNDVLALNPAEDYEHKALLLCNIAACNNTMGNFKVAEAFANQAIEIAKRKNNQPELANALNILARSYYQQGNIQKAIPILKQAALIREKVAEPSMLASDYLELADVYIKNGQFQEAIQWATKAEEISLLYGNTLKLDAAYRSLSSAYESVGDHRNAYLYLQKLLLHKDSLSDDHYNKAFAQMQVQYETQKKTAENLTLKKQNLEASLNYSNQQRWVFALVAGLVLLAASGIYITKLMKSRYRINMALTELDAQKKRTLAVMEAEETERRRIAGDLHDGVGQTLAAASLQLDKARAGSLSLDKVDTLINQASTEVRALSHQVTPELLLHYGLVKAIEQAVDKLNDANDKTSFRFFKHVEEELKDDMASLTLYRCFQELTTNIIKHAKASEVIVQLNIFNEETEMIIEDNGTGFDPAIARYGLGIKNIESRLALYDGRLIIDSTPGMGSTIIIKIRKGSDIT